MNQQTNPNDNGYRLLDSGEGEKLEAFGDIVLSRPSSLSVWKKRRPDLWRSANATFEPNKDWKRRHLPKDEWRVSFAGMTLLCRLQSNGQVGLFPEHVRYLEAFAGAPGEGKRALNLFAFTGMATIYLLQRRWQVCHVDISKRAIEWANANIEANNLPREGVQMICEDALRYLAREVKRGKRYDLVIADPPSFSRLTKESSWNLEEVAAELVSSALQLLPDGHGTLLLASHHHAIGGRVLANLIVDAAKAAPSKLRVGELELAEEEGLRMLPSGSYAAASFD